MIDRRISSAAATFAVLLLAVVGSASAFEITAGDIKFTIDSFDSGTVGYGNTNGIKCVNIAGCDAAASIPAPGSIGSVDPSADTMGIFSVALITNISTGQVLFTKGVNGFLTGIFGNLSDALVEVTGCGGIIGCSTSALSLGGTFKIWQNATDYNPALGPLVGAGKDLNADLYPGISGGSLYLSGVFSPGVLAGDLTHTYLSTFNNNTFAGAGQGFLDLTGGSAFNTFNTNAITDANGNQHDLFLDVTFNDVNGAASNLGWTVTNSGQVKGNAVVPEPGSLVLLALGGLVAGWASSRRKAM
jgi:PEP-CTERM motif-containing protein